VKISVVHPADLGPAELDRWRQLQGTDPRLANPFLAPEFTLAVAGARPASRVAVLESDGGIVGFFPFEVRRRVVGRPIGHGISDCQGLIHEPGLELDAVELLRACGLPVWEFDHLIADQKAFQPYHSVRTGSPVMDVSGGYQAYVDDRMSSSDVIRQALRKQRGMVRDLGPERFVWDERDATALSALMTWKSAQYARTEQYDRFSIPWIAQVIESLLASNAPGCRAIVSTVYAGDHLVAAHLGLRSESVLAYWFPSYDTDLAKYSAGILLCLRMAESGAADGIEHMDLGKSHAVYKDRLKNAELDVAEGRVERSKSVAMARRAQSAVSRSLRSGKVGNVLKSGTTGKILRRVKARVSGR
jgi:CelD/BcsL family acetyltransferase involved in cellulose biosynthesis